MSGLVLCWCVHNTAVGTSVTSDCSSSAKFIQLYRWSSLLQGITDWCENPLSGVDVGVSLYMVWRDSPFNHRGKASLVHHFCVGSHFPNPPPALVRWQTLPNPLVIHKHKTQFTDYKTSFMLPFYILLTGV